VLEHRVVQIILTVFLAILAAGQLAVISMIPGWTQPEGLAAGAIWGAIVFFGLLFCVAGGLLAVILLVLVRDTQKRKLIIFVELSVVAGLVAVMAILPLIPSGPGASDPGEAQRREAELREQYRQQNESDLVPDQG